MLKKSFRRKSKKLLKSRNKKRVSKKSQKKIRNKKAFSPSAAVIVPVVIGTLGLLTASGYYGIKYYKEKKFKDNISSFIQEIKDNVIKNKENIICNICHEKIGDNNNYEELPCKHIFHKDCMQQWTDSQFVMVNNWKFIRRERLGHYKLDYTCPACRDVYDSITREGQNVVNIIRQAGKTPEYHSSV